MSVAALEPALVSVAIAEFGLDQPAAQSFAAATVTAQTIAAENPGKQAEALKSATSHVSLLQAQLADGQRDQAAAHKTIDGLNSTQSAQLKAMGDLSAERDAAVAEVKALADEIATLTGDRDAALRASKASASQVATLTTELAAARAVVIAQSAATGGATGKTGD